MIMERYDLHIKKDCFFEDLILDMTIHHNDRNRAEIVLRLVGLVMTSCFF